MIVFQLFWFAFLVSNFTANYVTVNNDYAFVSSGENGVHIIYVADPLRKYEVGFFDTPGSANKIKVYGSYAYVVDGDSGLRIIDVSDPSSPYEISSYNPGSKFSDILVTDRYIFVADWWLGLRILDKTDITNLTEVSRWVSDDDYRTIGISIKSNYVYLLQMDNTLWHSARVKILDISNVSNPHVTGEIPSGSAPISLCIKENLMFVATSYTLLIYDLTNPNQPNQVGSYNVRSYGALFVDNNLAFVPSGYDGLKIIDISNLNNIHTVGNFNTPSDYVKSVYVRNSKAYLGVVSSGLEILDISNLENIQGIGFHYLPHGTNGVYSNGNLAYVTNAWNGFNIINVSNPLTPKIEGSYDGPEMYGITVRGNFAYSAGRYGMYIFDISDPANPQQINLLHRPQWAKRVYLKGQFAYVANGHLHIIDISNPYQPNYVREYSPQGGVNDVVVKGRYAYIIGEGEISGGNFWVVDVSNPSTPLAVGHCFLPERYSSDDPQGLDVYGQYAYVANNRKGLGIIDISDPFNPVVIGTCQTPGFARRVKVYYNYAYVADGDGGVRIIDVSDPHNPYEVAHYDVSAAAQDIQVVNNMVYVATDNAIWIFKAYNQSVHGADLAADYVRGFYENDDLIIIGDILNNGDNRVQNVPVKIVIRNSETNSYENIRDTVIASIEPGEVKEIRIQWTPNCKDVSALLFVDPDNIINEINEENNSASCNIRITGVAKIDSVIARYDGDEREDIFGRFISGIDLIDTFSVFATCQGSDCSVTKVIFKFGQETLIDSIPSDGWRVSYNVGALTAPTYLKVIAVSDRGLISDTNSYLINTIPTPDWIERCINTYGCSLTFDYTNGVYRTGQEYFPVNLRGTYQVPHNILFLGDLTSTLSAGIRLNSEIPLNPHGSLIPVTPEFGFNLKLLGIEIFQGNFYDLYNYLQRLSDSLGRPLPNLHPPNAVLTGYVDPSNFELSELEYSLYEPIRFFSYPLPEAHFRRTIPVHGIPITLGMDIGGELFSNLQNAGFYIGRDLSFDSLFLVPSAGITVDLAAKVDVVFGVASAACLAHPTALLEAGIRYPPITYNLSGAFTLPFELVGSLGWGLLSGTLYSDTLGPWTFGTKGEYILKERLPVMLSRINNLNIPDILPNPQIVSNDLGQALAVWIHDIDPQPGSADPDVYYAIWNGNSWSTPAAVDSVTNNVFEMDPSAAFLPNGDAIAVWSGNTASSRVKDINEIFSTQDIYYSFWHDDEHTWTSPQKLINDNTADGLPSVASGPNGDILVLWTKVLGDSISDKKTWAIYYSHWHHNSWSTPLPLPETNNDNSADCEVKVAYSPRGEALAVWIYDEDGDFETYGDTHLKYAVWNGTQWSTPQFLTITSDSESERSVSITYDNIGRALVVWHSKDSITDKIYFTIRDTNGNWSTPQTVFTTNLFAYEPLVKVDSRGIATILWRGYSGYDGEIFYTLKNINNNDSWIEPHSLTNDSLTDWLLTATIDDSNNLLYLWSKWDWESKRVFMTANDAQIIEDGLYFSRKKINADLSLSELNNGTHSFLPDLSISNSFLSLSDTFPGLGDTLTICARIKNDGDVRADSINIKFHYRIPDSIDSIIKDTTLLFLYPGDSSVINTQVQVQSEQDSALIYVILDNQNRIIELDESNNSACVAYYLTGDLSIDSADIQFSNDNPIEAETLLINVKIHNIGESSTNPTIAKVYNGNPHDTSSTVIDSFDVPEIPCDSFYTHNTYITADYGIHPIYVIVDPNNTYKEPSKSNNIAFNWLRVLPDMSVNTLQLDTIGINLFKIISVVTNIGGVNVDSVVVFYYDGNPMDNGIIIDSVLLETLNINRPETLNLNLPLSVGNHDIYILIDPMDNIEERDEYNNSSYISITVRDHPDLVVSRLFLSSMYFHDEDTVHLSSMIKNIGNVNAFDILFRAFLLDSSNSSQMIYGRTIPMLGSGDSLVVDFYWTIPETLQGFYRINVVIDPLDSIAENNENNNADIKNIYIDLPKIMINPDSIDIVCDWGDSTEFTLEITNVGTAPLSFSIGANYSKSGITSPNIEPAKIDSGWINFSTDSGYIAENDTVNIIGVLNSSGLSAGFHDAEIIINSNDFITPILRIPISFGVRPSCPINVFPADSQYISDSTPTLIWSSISANCIFEYQIAMDSLFTNIVDSNRNVNDTLTEIEYPLTVDTTYWWRIRAITNDGLLSEFSRPSMFILDTHPPNTPVILNPFNGLWLNTDSILLKWGDTKVTNPIKFSKRKNPDYKDISIPKIISSPIKYVVEISIAGSSGGIIDTVNVDSLMIALNDGFYTWRVKAFDLAGNSSNWSETDSFGIDTQPPMKVTLIQPVCGQIFNVDTVVFIWSSAHDNGSGIRGYWLEIGWDSVRLNDSVFVQDTTYAIQLIDSTYYWKVITVDNAGNKNMNSDLGSFSIDTYAPETPQLIYPLSRVWISFDTVTLRWTSVSFNKYHPLQTKSTPVRYIIKVDSSIVDTTDTNFYETELSNGPHYWQVLAFDLAGNESNWSEIDSFGVDTEVPVVDSFIGYPDSGYIYGPWRIIAWAHDNVSGIDSMILFFIRNNGVQDSLQMVQDSNNWFGVIPSFNSTYPAFAFIKAYDYAGNIGVSDTIDLIATSIKDTISFYQKVILNKNIYIASSDKYLILKAQAVPLQSISIYDVEGRRIWSRSFTCSNGNRIIRIKPNFQAGMYFILITLTDEEKYLYSVLIIK